MKSFLSLSTITLAAGFADIGDAFVSPNIPSTTTTRLYEDVVNGGADVYEPNSKSAFDRYKETYDQSIQDPEGFWGAKAREYLDWEKDYESVLEGSMEHGDIR